MQSQVQYNIDDNHIAVITFDLPNKSMNVLTEQGIAEFKNHVETAISDDKVKGIVITSGKKDFLGGVDLSMLNSLCDPFSRTPKQNRTEKGFDLIMNMHQLLRKLETSGKPVACAITGTCMGGGLEIALACHYRIVADKPKAQLGLPESKVGLLPGFGGTQRLPRLLGIQASAEALLQGKSYNPQKAYAMGIVHAVTPEKKLLSDAKKWILNAKPDDAKQPWDKKDFKIPHGNIYTPAGYQMMAAGIAMTRHETKGLYKAQDHILACVYEGLQVPFEQAMVIEVRHFVHLMTDGQAFNMIRTLFLSKQALEKGARRPSDIAVTKFKKIAVIGAGMMGAGIAFVAAKAGIKVFLFDTDIEKAIKGKAHVEKLCADLLKKKHLDEKSHAKLLDLIVPETEFLKLKGVDLVIEAAFEDTQVKSDIFKKIEPFVGNKCIIASNTSTLPIDSLAESLTFKKNFIGIHFFSPVDKMPLVEIIIGKKTGDRALAKALDFVKAIKKTPIVVNDNRFFYANRCIIPYIEEAHRMVTEGVNPTLIENAATMLGFPLGPLQLNDEVSLTLSHKIQEMTKQALGKSYTPSPADELIQLMLKLKRTGKASGAGFYDYHGHEKLLFKGLSKYYPLAEKQPSLNTVQKRLLNIQIIEAIRAVEDKVITDIRDADVGAIFGWGFCPWSGGPLSYVDMIGTGDFMRECDKMAREFGVRFKSPKLLKEMGKGGERFYVRYNPEMPHFGLKDIQKTG
jgi:3-hydroxyacyl-CoA dehydrogenase/enoyl-CoA hydratase/3-hydroxybutyryl-CoA epimerase